MPFIETLADQIAVAIENARLMERARELAASDERNRLAREIHDSSAQSLIAVSMELDAIQQRRADDPPRVVGLVSHARELAHRAVEEARHAIWRLRPAPLERQSLSEALAAEVRSLEQGGAVEQSDCTRPGRAPPAGRRGRSGPLPRSPRRRSRTSASTPRPAALACVLAYGERSVRLLIEDDGRGFDPGASRRTG